MQENCYALKRKKIYKTHFSAQDPTPSLHTHTHTSIVIFHLSSLQVLNERKAFNKRKRNHKRNTILIRVRSLLRGTTRTLNIVD